MSIFGTVTVAAYQTRQLFGAEQNPVLIQNQSNYSMVLSRTQQTLSDVITVPGGQAIRWNREEPCWATNNNNQPIKLLVGSGLDSSNVAGSTSSSQVATNTAATAANTETIAQSSSAIETAVKTLSLPTGLEMLVFTGTVTTANTFQSTVGDTAARTSGPVASFLIGNPGADTLVWAIANVTAGVPTEGLFTQPVGAPPFVWNPPAGSPETFQPYVTSGTAGAKWAVTLLAVGPIID